VCAEWVGLPLFGWGGRESSRETLGAGGGCRPPWVHRGGSGIMMLSSRGGAGMPGFLVWLRSGTRRGVPRGLGGVGGFCCRLGARPDRKTGLLLLVLAMLLRSRKRSVVNRQGGMWERWRCGSGDGE